MRYVYTMKTISRPSSVVALLLLLTSCNVVRMAEKSAAKEYRQAGMTEHTFASPEGPRHVWASASTGKPWLMVVHGVTGNCGQYASNAEALSEHFDLIAPDLIGHGLSTNTWSGNSVDQQVAHMRLILDSLGVHEPVYLVGNSYGGAISANFAEQHPDRTRLLVIYDGPANAYTHAVADSVARSLGAESILDFFEPTTLDERERNLNAILAKPRKIPRFALKQMGEAGVAHLPVYQGLLKDLVERDAQYANKRYMWSMPVYVIWGAEDRLIPLFVGEGIMRINELPADHWIVIPNAGHVANMEVPNTFNSVLLKIFKPYVDLCPDPARVSEGACTAEFDPQCGCDGKTYPNKCMAWRAGVRVVKSGECK